MDGCMCLALGRPRTRRWNYEAGGAGRRKDILLTARSHVLADAAVSVWNARVLYHYHQGGLCYYPRRGKGPYRLGTILISQSPAGRERGVTAGMPGGRR